MPWMTKAVPQHQPQLVRVPLDNFVVLTEDDVLCATLSGSLAVCLYDAVEESGAMLHLRVVATVRRGLDVSDEVLAADLMLLERCINALKNVAPNARHAQGKLVAHCGADGSLQPAATASVEFIKHYLHDARIKVVQEELETGRPVDVQFRPAMGQLRKGD
jgi:chemotaxis receptor (MCP) glutamine deamidase CheD